MSYGDPNNPYNAPQYGAAKPQQYYPDQGDATGGVIPYKNPHALIAYYLAIGSLLLGPLLGIPALVLGIIGLMKRKQNPVIKGSVHAWIGIILGGGCTITHSSCIGLAMVSWMAQF